MRLSSIKKIVKRNIKCFFARNRSIILGYHGVTDHDMQFSNWIQINKNIFEEHISYLSQNFRCVRSSELLQDIVDKKLSFNTVCITFDDGYANNFYNALPVLQKYGVPATIFLSTGYLDTKRLLWHDLIFSIIAHTQINNFEMDGQKYRLGNREEKRLTYRQIINKYKYFKNEKKNEITSKIADILKVNIKKLATENDLADLRILNMSEIKEMKRSGLVEFGSHTESHSILSLLPHKQAREEIANSKKNLEKIFTPVNLFSYPNGTGRDFNEEHIKILQSLRFACAVTTIPGRVSSNCDLFCLPRVCIGNNCNVEDLDYILYNIA